VTRRIDPAIGHLIELADEVAGDAPGLLAVLARVADPQRRRGVRHRLAVMVGLAVCAVLTRGRSFTAITPAIIAIIGYVGYLVDTKAPEGPYFEVAIIHHTDCDSTLLADDELRLGFAQRIGTDERTLATRPVLDPARTVQTDVAGAVGGGDPAECPRLRACLGRQHRRSHHCRRRERQEVMSRGSRIAPLAGPMADNSPHGQIAQFCPGTR
jgi:hypothetical protein